MEYRWLTGPEAVDLLNPLIAKRNADDPEAAPWMLLNSRTTLFCRAALEGDFVIGFLVLQMVPSMGPFLVERFARNGEVSAQLVGDMVQAMGEMEARGVLVVCENVATERMCKSRGMKRIDLPIYVSGEVRI